MLLASALTASFVIAGLSAWRLLRAPADAHAGKTLRAALRVAALLVPAQILVGDMHGLNTLEHQPAKIAGIEAIWHTGREVPLALFAVPDEENRRNDYAIEIPYGASLILAHDAHAELKGLDAFGADRPPVAPLFFGFRIMVGIGLLMLAASWLGTWLTRGARAAPRALLWTLSAMTFSGWAATLAGWIVTEVGRQPWLVYGVLRTRDAVGGVGAAQLGASFTAYLITYVALFAAYMVVLTHLAGKGAQ
jgi:cytochrome d ubiquinol oxidase subunit I